MRIARPVVESSSIVDGMLRALRSGHVAIHPTDTIPGLTFDPSQLDAWRKLCALKEREATKSLLSLVESPTVAFELWQELPAIWCERLASLWPGPLSVVWQARPGLPDALVADGGTIGLRCPALAAEDLWYFDVLRGMDGYLPTTSINTSGQPPARSTAECRRFADEHPEVYLTPAHGEEGAEPSTVIRLDADGGWTMLRPGSSDTVQKLHQLCGEPRS